MLSIEDLFEEADDEYIRQRVEAFEEYIDDDGDCYEWEGTIQHTGYGAFWFHEREVRAHRLALYLDDLKPIEGVDALHSCHNRSCVNPEHLRRGDASDNQIDSLKAERHHRMKLSPDDVRTIRERYENENVTQTELADEYGIGQDQISRIVNRKRWGWLD